MLYRDELRREPFHRAQQRTRGAKSKYSQGFQAVLLFPFFNPKVEDFSGKSIKNSILGGRNYE